MIDETTEVVEELRGTMSMRQGRKPDATQAVTAPSVNAADALMQRTASMREKASSLQTPEAIMDDLTPVEQAVVKLDVDPQGLKPIDWLNRAHYDNLKKSNSLSDDLQRRIEAFKHVSNTA